MVLSFSRWINRVIAGLKGAKNPAGKGAPDLSQIHWRAASQESHQRVENKIFGLEISDIALSNYSGKRKRMRNCRGVCVKRLFTGSGAQPRLYW